MSNDSPEEKKHPPSQRRLDQLRRDGQAPQAQELRTGVSFGFAVAMLLATAGTLQSSFWALFAAVLTHADPTQSSLSFVSPLTGLASSVGYIVAASALAYILASIMDSGGVLISSKSLTPSLSKINPLSNLKERFTLRNGVDLLRGLIKALLLLGLACVVGIRHGASVINAPLCGPDCVALVGIRMVLEITAAAILILLVSGLLDLLISRSLFRRQHKMTQTEVKREQKDDFGAPEIRRKRREFWDEIMQGPRPAREEEANLVVVGSAGAAAIQVSATGEAPPVLVRLAQGGDAAELVAAARSRATPVVAHEEALSLLRGGRRGDFIPEESFQVVAACARTAGLL